MLRRGFGEAEIDKILGANVLRVFRHTLLELLREEPQLMLKLLTGIVRRIRAVERQVEVEIGEFLFKFEEIL